MSGRPKPKPHHKKSIVKEVLEHRKGRKDLENDDCLVISLKHLDANQGQTLHAWDEQGILANAIEHLAGRCHRRALEQRDGNYTVYPYFPPPDKTRFVHPTHVPEDAEWVRIHVNGTQCIIGHIVDNVLYVVFLDGNHEFWISEKKHT